MSQGRCGSELPVDPDLGGRRRRWALWIQGRRAVTFMASQLPNPQGHSLSGSELLAAADSMWRASVPTHERSPRPLPTDHDHDGGPQARSANFTVINRRASTSTGASSVPGNCRNGGNNSSRVH